LQHGSNKCKNCHAPDIYHSQGTAGPKGRVENPGWQLISPIDNAGCHDCHSTHNGLDEPFHGPGIDPRVSNLQGAIIQGSYHARTNQLRNGSDCSFSCHLTTVHNVREFKDSNKPKLENLSLSPSSVIINSPVTITANGSSISTSTSLQVEAAQYQIEDNANNMIQDWTAMNAEDGKFDSLIEKINATINTTGMPEGTYKVYVRVMASAPRTNLSILYYPQNGDWSAPLETTLIIEQPKGFINGTVRNGSISGNEIQGVTVRTNTDVSTVTDISGFYSLRLPNGTYALTATKDPEYYPNITIPVRTVTAYFTEDQDIIMKEKPTGTISGVVTNSNSGYSINGVI
jgi:hypothetical protein